MPWCPKCETEYREGILTCADCGSTLVENLNLNIDFLKAFLIDVQ